MASVAVDQKSDRRDAADRRFFGVVFASLLFHVVGFAALLPFDQHHSNDPPCLVMVDMTAVVPPEPTAVKISTPRDPVPPPSRSPASVVPPSLVTSHPVSAPVTNSSPVPVAVIGDALDTRTAPARTDLTIPVAVPVARKLQESSSSGPIAVAGTGDKSPPADGAEKLIKARTSYRALIAALIDRNKEYPLFARKAGQQGTCSVRCTMMCDGTIKRVELVKSSGYETLDKAGLRAVNNVIKFPPPPHDGGCTEVAFEVPITFRLG